MLKIPSESLVSQKCRDGSFLYAQDESKYVKYLKGVLMTHRVEHYQEVVGEYEWLPHFRSSGNKSPRIDFIIVIKGSFIGVECKRPTDKLGRPILLNKALAQIMDYQLFSRFYINGQWIRLSYCLIAPCNKVSGVIASIMAQNRLGNLMHNGHEVMAYSASNVIFRIAENGIETGPAWNVYGKKTGSR